MPKTEAQWRNIAKEFEDKWNFPNCIGALDGKHINMICPRNSGSYYFDYKGFFSIVLMGLVDADYKFIYMDVGCNGSISDGGVFRNGQLSKALEKNTLNIPPAEILPNSTKKLPFVVVGDDAFPLKKYLMKPYPHQGLSREKRILNYRLSRARRIVENAFGILANRFRVFMTTIHLSPDNIESLVLASYVLHNYLRTKSADRYTPPGSFDKVNKDGTVINGNWREDGCLQSIGKQGSNFYAKNAKQVRDEYCNYFDSDGKVAWQDDYI